ncbi:nicotinate-nucleotide adenylyltransferase [uncultured Sphaerotilus sp.]|uniref:nicotinate-nucleotide adenylyltransferase n=1 Tax=uncultured Sphaerotilus sp. TaxID=474984 RepID=UPI0030CA1733
MAAEPRRIGLYGGSFDPVHQAHRVLADTALAQLALDELRWIPAGQPWQKTRRLAPAEHRAEMVALAIGDNPAFVLEKCEVERTGPSYTLDTVTLLQQRERHPARWFLIIGQDQLAGFCTWHGWAELLQRVTLAVAGRAGVPVQAPAELLNTGHRIVALDMPSMSVSSTDLRKRLAAGEPASSLAPRMVAPAVARYIDRHGLYRNNPPSPQS